MSFSVTGASLILLGAATAAPSVGVVHNTRENGWLQFECDPVLGERLRCDITQVMVRKKLQPTKVESEFQKEVSGWPISLAEEFKTSPDRLMDAPKWKEMCAMADQIVEAIRTGKAQGITPEAAKEFAAYNEMQRRDTLATFEAMQASCQARSLDGFRRVVRQGLEKKSRTCYVGTNRFEQVFRPVRGHDDELVSWTVADTSPQGDCGFVQFSRFKPEPTKAGETVFLWQYIAKRTTGNPDGTTMLGTACKEFEEVEVLYDWRAKEIPLQCDYIEYSPF